MANDALVLEIIRRHSHQRSRERTRDGIEAKHNSSTSEKWWKITPLKINLLQALPNTFHPPFTGQNSNFYILMTLFEGKMTVHKAICPFYFITQLKEKKKKKSKFRFTSEIFPNCTPFFVTSRVTPNHRLEPLLPSPLKNILEANSTQSL